jgi:hypothetical protein
MTTGVTFWRWQRHVLVQASQQGQRLEKAVLPVPIANRGTHGT